MDAPATTTKAPHYLVDVIKRGDNEVLLAYLKQHKEQVNAVVEGCNYGETLLHYAAWHNNEKAVVYLVQHGADLTSKGTTSGCTPLHSAAAAGHLSMVALLIGLGADGRPSGVTQWTPLHSACLRGHEDVAWYLERQGLNMKHRNADGHSGNDLLARALAAKQQHSTTSAAGGAIQIQDLLDSWGKLHIQIASDTHVEFYASFSQIPELIKPRAPILALLGDIGNPALPTYRDFVYHQAQQFKLVLLLSGNHEFYSPHSGPPHPTIGELNQAIHDICAAAPRKNVIYLDKGLLELPGGYSIMGCILWSDIPPDRRHEAAQAMNDYRLIYKSSDGRSVLTPDDTAAEHASQVRWLQEQIKASMAKGNKAVVLTHHTPTYRVSGSGLAFSSSLEYLFKNRGTNVAVWAHGHTHYNDDRLVDGTRVVSNMVGYRHDMNSDYRPDLVITID